jgi:hypothetical protein
VHESASELFGLSLHYLGRDQFATKKHIERFCGVASGETVDHVPFVVLAKRVIFYWKATICMKSGDLVEHRPAHFVRFHKYAMRKFSIKPSPRSLSRSVSHGAMTKRWTNSPVALSRLMKMRQIIVALNFLTSPSDDWSSIRICLSARRWLAAYFDCFCLQNR